MADFSTLRPSIVTVPKAQTVITAGFIQPFAGDISGWQNLNGVVQSNGWAVCDGSVVDQANFPDLYEAIGSTWDTFNHPNDGAPVVGGGQFALPNLQGMFLGGTGNNGDSSFSLGTFSSDLTAVNGLSTNNSSASWNSSNITTNNGSASWNSSAITTNSDNHTHGLTAKYLSSATAYSSGNHNDRTAVTSGLLNSTGASDVANTAIASDNHSHSFNKNELNSNQNSHGHTFNKNLLNSNQVAHSHGMTGDSETRPKTAGVYFIIALHNNVTSNAIGIPDASDTQEGVVNTTDQTFAGNKTFTGTISGSGTIPLGSVIAVLDNYGNTAVPASGTIDDNGFQLCDGAVLAAGATITGTNVPNISDNRFLRGSTVSGTVGGSASKSLLEANLPSHDHSMTHTHSINHSHGDNFSIANGGSHAHTVSIGNSGGGTASITADGISAGNRSPALFVGTTNNTGSHSHTLNGSVSATNASSGNASSSNTGNAGSGTSFNIEPAYLNVKYLIRVR